MKFLLKAWCILSLAFLMMMGGGVSAEQAANENGVSAETPAEIAAEGSNPVMKRIENAKVVAFGDSITRLGSFKESEKEKTPSPKKTYWLDTLAKKYSWNLVNSGVNGSTTTHGLKRLQKDVLDHKPDIVLIGFGMNDHVMRKKNEPAVKLEQFETNLTTMVEKIRAIGAEPIFITTNYIDEEKYYKRHDPAFYEDVEGAQAWLDQYIGVMRKLGEELKVGVADVRAECDNFDLSKFTTDGVHPNNAGQSVYIKAVGDFLETLRSGEPQ
ncbi:SGNH/GDSL hydrolase family protein [Paenibacillus hamazuiensis]|uniref:SGNH/GDSL hydrolase family protein n=1 Tax=Paenibacillus hamazuiensis TaxID=2936508 RepID=UPI00200C613F|nr:SGNH/GDSL hydrolase family protein [Paenibacillus hamazuiensis]